MQHQKPLRGIRIHNEKTLKLAMIIGGYWTNGMYKKITQNERKSRFNGYKHHDLHDRMPRIESMQVLFNNVNRCQPIER